MIEQLIHFISSGNQKYVVMDLLVVLREVKKAKDENRRIRTDASWSDAMCVLGAELEKKQ